MSFARALDRVIFYGLLVTIALTAIPYGTVHPWWIALFECTIFLLGILGLVEILISKKPFPKGLSVAVPLLALCLFIFFQTFPIFSVSDNTALQHLRLSVSADPYSSFQFCLKLFALIVAGLLLLNHTSSERRLRTLIYTVIGVGIASALFGILKQSVQATPGWLLALPNDGRGFAQFVNRNHFGFLMEMSLGLTLGLLVRGTAGYRRFLVFLAIAVFMWVALILSNSRGGIFASLCQLLFLGVVLDPLRHFTSRTGPALNRFQNLVAGFAVRAVLICGLVALFAYGVGWVGGERVVSNFELTRYAFTQQGNDYRHNVSRREIWAATWELIKAHPLAGAGFGGYWIAITRYHDASGEFTPQEAHNDYLELLASGGLIGLALVAWFAVLFVNRARNTLRSSDHYLSAAAIGALTGIFGVMIHSFVDFGLHVTVNALICSVLLVIAAPESLLDKSGREARALIVPTDSR